MVGTLPIKFDANWLDPDLYRDVSRLPTTMTMKIPIGITNNEDVTLYFQVTLVGPPVAYSTYTHDLGSIVAGGSDIFVYSMDRTHPVLVAGEYDENIVARVIAYTDALYSVVYAQQDLLLSVHHFDHEDAAWNEVLHDHFDNGLIGAWSIQQRIDFSFSGYHIDATPSIAGGTFLSSPYSLYAIGGFAPNTRSMRKTVDASGLGYTKARVVFHYFCAGGHQVALKVADELILSGAVSVLIGRDEWIRVSYDFPVDVAAYIYLQGSETTDRFDEIWVIAK